nr:hypothetical protein [Tanacetum cinerariifolium]
MCSTSISKCHSSEHQRFSAIHTLAIQAFSLRCPELQTLSLKRSSMAHAGLNCPLLHDLDIASCHKLVNRRMRISTSCGVTSLLAKIDGCCKIDRFKVSIIRILAVGYVAGKRIQLKRDKSEQNRIKTGQKREAWRSPEKSKAVAVGRGRKTEENAKRMIENAYTVKELFKF